MNTLFGLIPLFLLLVLLERLGNFIYTKYFSKLWVDKFSPMKTTYVIIICWTIFGFFTNIDYTENWGCLIFSEQIFSAENIIYSAITIILVSFGVFIPSGIIGKVVLTCELLFWLYKLFIIKGGYAVGYSGVPSVSVLAFDTIALALRLILLKQAFQIKVKTLPLLMITFFVILIKIQFFR